MGRYIGPTNKIARRFGINLGLKSNPTKVARRLSQPPGAHGPKSKGRGRGGSGYGKQLLEKQKAKFLYGLRERQFRRYVDEATRVKGDSGRLLQEMLERRFDNVIYRLGFGLTRAQARQMITHGMFYLNGRRLTIPSHLASAGDLISIRPNKTKKKIFDGMAERLRKHQVPSWLTVNPADMTAKVIGKPAGMDMEQSFDVRLIIEFYSSR